AVAGGSFAACQFFFARSPAFALTDIAGGLISLVVTAAFLRFWQPRRLWRFDLAPEERGGGDHETEGGGRRTEGGTSPSSALRPASAAPSARPAYLLAKRMSLQETLVAWMPFIILCALMVGVGTYKAVIDGWNVGPVRAVYEIQMPQLHQLVRRMP